MGLPDANVHKVGTGTPEKEAGLYEAQMRGLDREILPIDEENGLPAGGFHSSNSHLNLSRFGH